MITPLIIFGILVLAAIGAIIRDVWIQAIGDAFETGLNFGKVVGQMSQMQIDEIVKDSGLDPRTYKKL